jgi:hypothetical protein
MAMLNNQMVNGAFNVKIIYKRRMFKQTTFNWGYPPVNAVAENVQL